MPIIIRFDVEDESGKLTKRDVENSLKAAESNADIKVTKTSKNFFHVEIIKSHEINLMGLEHTEK